MKHIFLFIIISTLFFSCKQKTLSEKPDNLKIQRDSVVGTFKTEEEIIDSTSIGIKGKFKIDIHQIRHIGDSVYITYNLFEKQNKIWKLKQSFKMGKDGVTNLGLEFKDFNNDGFKDMTVHTDIAGRGANDLRSLFIFDKKKGEFILIKNSSNFPNLQYNKVLNCIDALMVYGGSSTVFLKLDADTLREFAEVEQFQNIRTVYEFDSKGKKKILSKIKVNDSTDYIRFSNYKPLKININNDY